MYEHTIIRRNNSVLDANHCTIDGSNNRIRGDHLTINGDNNYVQGNHLKINGSNNTSVGNHIHCLGSNNTATGSFCSTHDSNTITQMNMATGYNPDLAGLGGTVFNVVGNGFAACNIFNSVIGHGSSVSINNSFSNRSNTSFGTHTKVNSNSKVIPSRNSNHSNRIISSTTIKQNSTNSHELGKSNVPNLSPTSSINKKKTQSNISNCNKGPSKIAKHDTEYYNYDINTKGEYGDHNVDIGDDFCHYLSDGEEEFVLNPDETAIYSPSTTRNNNTTIIVDISKDECQKEWPDDISTNFEKEFKIEYDKIILTLERPTTLLDKSSTHESTTGISTGTSVMAAKDDSIKINGRNCIGCKTGSVETLFLNCCHSMLCVKCSFNENIVKKFFHPAIPPNDASIVSTDENRHRIRCPFGGCSSPITSIIKIK